MANPCTSDSISDWVHDRYEDDPDSRQSSDETLLSSIDLL